MRYADKLADYIGDTGKLLVEDYLYTIFIDEDSDECEIIEVGKDFIVLDVKQVYTGKYDRRFIPLNMLVVILPEVDA